MNSELLPPIGLGTWENDDPKQCARTVKNALDMGYRHVDTARYYGNEAAVGDGIEASDVSREEIFLATKVHPLAEGLSYEGVHEGVEKSCQHLGVEYLDLLYVHWPVGNYDPDETLRAFDELVDDGRIRNVGVSNFDAELIEEARSVLDAPILANQVERHPLLPQQELVEHAQNHEYTLVAYSPLAQAKAFSLPEVRTVAKKHDISPAAACLAWVTAPDNVVTIPKATGTEHLRDNLEAGEIELDAEDIELIDGIETRERLFDRDGSPWS